MHSLYIKRYISNQNSEYKQIVLADSLFYDVTSSSSATAVDECFVEENSKLIPSSTL